MVKTDEKRLRSLIDRFEGDKVIWMIALLLILISVVTVFTSTPLLAIQQRTTRFDIIKDHLMIVGIGLAVIIVLYNIKNIRFFKFISQFGFIISFLMLLFLVFKVGADPADPTKGWPVRAAVVNDSWRIIVCFGIQIHVYEVVKVAMVMYLAWAVNAMREDSFSITAWLQRQLPNWKWLEHPLFIKSFYIYIPILLTSGMMLNGGTSATLLFMMMMFLILFVGGVDLKEIFALVAVMALYLAMVFMIYKTTGFSLHERITKVNVETRTGSVSGKLERVMEAKPSDRRKVIDDMKLEQPVGALIAIKEGGPLGKGIGRSNQKYKVAVIFEDYIFSFIIEETGWWGAIIIMILYLSLLARGSMIARICDDYFAKFAMAGLIVLISVQAFMHMAINVHLLPQTGQTLPMISHGASSFLCFCGAFGVILSISRMAHTQMLKDSSKADPLVEKDDEVQSSLNDLESLESEEI